MILIYNMYGIKYMYIPFAFNWISNMGSPTDLFINKTEATY